MSGNKYADLPDIDTAPDIYETEDILPTSQTDNVDSSDEEAAVLSRPNVKIRNEIGSKEELDVSNLIGADEASKRFRKAEKRFDRLRPHHVYSSSPSFPASPTEPSHASRPVSLSHRLRALQNELASLEGELADPSNPLIQKEREEENIDPGELIRGVVDVRGRLDKIRKMKEGRGRLVNVVLDDVEGLTNSDVGVANEDVREIDKNSIKVRKSDVRSVVDLDKRIGELEKIIGSSNRALDETAPLPAPLLPLITRLSVQLTLLTQPRHIDSISRRLKLLASDLDRASASHRRHPSQPNASAPPSQVQELMPILSRLGPALPHIPHILARLRTLSSLHASSSEFHSSINDLEQEQRKIEEDLQELEKAVQTVEKNLGENRSVVKSNVAGLENRVEILLRKINDLGREEGS